MSVKNRRTSLRTTINFQLGYDENTAISMTVKIPMNANYVIHRDILRHQISQKQGTVSTKTRSEVRGGGKKPWRQKGTGRARAGSSRSPLWKGGGVIFGPKPRTVSLKVNKKERKLALKFLMIQKLMTGSANGTMRIIPSQYDTLEEILATKQKTKAFSTYVQSGNIDLNEKLLLIVSKKSANVKLATRNLKNVELISASNLNTLSLLKAKNILITQPAFYEIKEIYGES
jgi:large subunit ribosomal protein L4